MIIKKKLNRLTIILLAFLVVFTSLLVYVSANGFYDKFSSSVSVDSSNLMSGGQVYRSENIIFYNEPDGLYHLNLVDNSTKKLFDKPVTNIGGISKEIYFEVDNSLYQTNLAGNEIKQIHTGGTNYQVQGSYIYYIDVAKHKLYKTRNDNALTFKIELSSVANVPDDFYYAVKNNEILYLTEDAIYKCNSDGSAEIVVYSGATSTFCIDKEIIFILTTDGELLLKHTNEVQDQQKFTQAEMFTTYDGDIFFTDGTGIKMIRISSNIHGGTGSNQHPITLCEDQVTAMYNFGGIIYFYDDLGDLYALSIDKVKTKIN